MLPAYILTVDITSRDPSIAEALFHEQVGPCLIYLDHLQGAFSRRMSTINYYPPDERSENVELKFWGARGVVLISVGIERAQYLMRLYQSIAKLIALELPQYEVLVEIRQIDFS